MSEHKTHAEIIAEQLTNIESLGDELPAVIAAGSLRKLLRHLDEAHKREIDDAERRGNHEAMAAVCETIEKAGPFYDAESVGNSVKMRKALVLLMDNLKIHLSQPIEQITINRAELEAMVKDCSKALAEPPRNCDVPFLDRVEMYGAFKDWCKAKGHTMEPMLAYDAFDWLLASVTKEGEGDGSK